MEDGSFINQEGLATVEAEAEGGLFGGEIVVVVCVRAVGELDAVAGCRLGEQFDMEAPRQIGPTGEGDVGRALGIGIGTRWRRWKRRNGCRGGR